MMSTQTKVDILNELAAEAAAVAQDEKASWDDRMEALETQGRILSDTAALLLKVANGETEDMAD